MESNEEIMDKKFKASLMNMPDGLILVGKGLFVILKSIGFIIYYVLRMSVLGLKSIWVKRKNDKN